MDENGIITIGSEVKPGDVLVGKITPKGEQELSSEERLLRAIFGEKAKDVRDTSHRVGRSEGGKVVDVKIFDRDSGYELRRVFCNRLKSSSLRLARSRSATS